MSSSDDSISLIKKAPPAKARPPATLLDRTVWHRKSKQGCRTCKIRKVKCDESRPLCRNCARRFPGIEKCDFDRPANAAGSASVTALTQAMSCRPNHVHESDRLRMLELRLMFHYTKMVHFELPDHGNKSAHEMWEFNIPQMSFNSEIVLSAMLAISALHLRMMAPGDANMTYAAGHYFGQTVRRYRPALGQITEDMAEPLLVTAMLIAYYTWLVAYTPAPGTPYTLPLQSFYLIKGVFDLLRQLGPWVKSSNLQWLYQQPAVSELAVPPPSVFMDIYQQDKERMQATFEDGNTTEEDIVVYQTALNYLTAVCIGLVTGQPTIQVRRKISYFVNSLPPRFLDLLARKDPRAMALLARDLSLLKVVDWAWWLHGPQDMASEEYHIRGICELMPIEWLWAMDWPLRIASGRLGLQGEEAIMECPKTMALAMGIPLRAIEMAPTLQS